MSCGGGGGTNSTITQQNQPPAAVQQAYQQLTGAAFGQAAQPQQTYTGPLVAGFTPQQQQGFQEVQNAQGMATPYINAAAQMFGQATTPFYNTVGSYESPYTGAVTNALQGLFNQQNAQQQQQVQGNATSAGAYGGDRTGVAQALTAQQQNLSEAPAFANALQGGYQTALGGAEAQGWLGEQGGFGLGNLGQEAQNSALTGASAELSAGGLQQQLAQEELNIPYEQFQSAQAYPWQVLGSLSPIVSGVGSLSGGTGSTSYPGPSLVSQLGGLGVAGLGTYGLLNQTGALGSLGGSVSTDAAGNIVPLGSEAATDFSGSAGSGILGSLGNLFSSGAAAAAAKTGGRIGFDSGGATPSGLPTVPTINLDYLVAPGPMVKGSGPPHAPEGSPEQFQGQTPLQEMQTFSGVGKMFTQAGIGGGEGSAFGGRVALQDGGSSGLAAAETTGAPLAGMPPNMQGFAQQLQTLPMDQLQAIAARTPPSTPYGQIVQRVLTSRRMTPTSGPQISSANGIPIGTGMGATPGMQPTQQAQTGGTSSLGPNQGGNPQSGYALGGPVPPIHEEPDMDPQPVVDHSGDTVVIHYPSEGKSLDLGIPTGRRKLAAGGSAAPPTTIGSGTSSSQPFFSSITGGNGIAIPQLSMDAFAAAPGIYSQIGPSGNFAPGSGMGSWFQPLSQFQPGSSSSGFGTFTPQLYNSPGTPWGQIYSQSPALSGLSGVPGFEKGGRTKLWQGGVDAPAVDPAPTVDATPAPTMQSGLAAPTAASPDLNIAPPPALDAGSPPSADQTAPTELSPRATAKMDMAASTTGVDPTVQSYLLNHVAPGESGGQFDRLYGQGHFGDFSKHPADQGWQGGIGPTGKPTHAAGILQDEPDTWHQVQLATGVPDFSPKSQIIGNAWLAKSTYKQATGRDLATDLKDGKVAQADQVLSSQWPSLAPKHGIGDTKTAGSPPYMTAPATMDTGSPQGGVGGATGSSRLNDAIENLIAQSQQSTPGSSVYGSPWMPVIAAGLGMMSSRSPYPLVGVGQGGLEGLKALGQQQAQIPENELRQAQALTARAQLLQMPMGYEAVKQMDAGPVGAKTPVFAPPGSPTTSNAGTPLNPNAAPSSGEVSTIATNAPAVSNLNPEQQAAVARVNAQLYPLQIQLRRAMMANNPTASESYQRQITDILKDNPDYKAAVTAAQGWAEMAPKIATAGGSAAATYPYDVGKQMAYGASRAVAVHPNEVTTTGLQVMPPEMQRQILQGPNAGPPQVGALGGQPNAATDNLPSTATTATPSMQYAQIPRMPEALPFTRPADLPPDPTMTAPESRMITLPGGGATVAPTLPGIHEFQEGAAATVKKAMEQIPELASRATALDTQHQEIVEASASGNPYAPGSLIKTRQRIGTAINTAAQIMGLSPPISQNELANSVAIDKARFDLSTSALHGFSPRPAQIEWQASNNSVPSNEQSAFTALLLSNTLRFRNSYEQGQSQFLIDQYKRRVPPEQAATMYQRKNGSRIVGAAVAQTYLDFAKSQPNEKISKAVNILLQTPQDQQASVAQLFDQRMKSSFGVDTSAFGVPSFGQLVIQLAHNNAAQ